MRESDAEDKGLVRLFDRYEAVPYNAWLIPVHQVWHRF